jgi:type IX secretion system PorP/SprF family membrane protein
MKLASHFLTLALLLVSLVLNAQYFQFSQYSFTEQQVNPSSISNTDYAKAQMVFRNQKVTDNLNINSTFLSGSYPIRSKLGPTAAIGLSLLDDRAGAAGIFRTTKVGVNISTTVPLVDGQSISLGVKSDWQNRKVSFDELSTGSQFVPDRGFVDGGTGELSDQFKASFFTWSAGFNWTKKDNQGNVLMQLGFSTFDINQPDESFFNSDSKLPSTFVFSLGGKVYDNALISLNPDLLVTRTSKSNIVTLGGVTRYELTGSSKINGYLNIITRYNLGGYAILGLQFENDKSSFGLSYDLPVSRQVGNQGTMEFALGFKKYIEPVASKAKIKKSKYAKRREKFKKQQVKLAQRRAKRVPKEEVLGDNKVVKTPEVKVELDSVQVFVDPKETIVHTENTIALKPEGDATAGELTRYPLDEPIAFNFKFGFNKVSLAKDDKDVLNDLMLLMIQNPTLKVDIVGHTDDTGKEDYNQKLSEDRAAAVAIYLMKKGIDDDRIMATGFGELKPLVSNDSDENRAINRRVEFIIHKPKTQTDDH